MTGVKALLAQLESFGNKKTVSSVSFLIYEDTGGCHSNQNSSDLRLRKFTSLSNRVHDWCRVFSRAAGLHVLAGYSWLLRSNSISISTCASAIVKVKEESVQKHTQLLNVSP